jgi:hypothetical protein
MLFKGFIGTEKPRYHPGIVKKGEANIEIDFKKIDEFWFTFGKFWNLVELVNGKVKILKGTSMDNIAGVNVSYDDWLYPSYSFSSIPKVQSEKEICFSSLAFLGVTGPIWIGKGTDILVKISTTDFTGIKKDEALKFKEGVSINPKLPFLNITPLMDFEIGSGRFYVGFSLL